MAEVAQKHLAVQELSKLKIEELTPLTPEVISRQVRALHSLTLATMSGVGAHSVVYGVFMLVCLLLLLLLVVVVVVVL